MKRRSFVAACLFLAIFLVGSPLCLGFRNLKEGEISPDFKLKDLNGKTHSLSQSKGKVIVILYWRVGQERSLKALKELKVIFEKLSDQPFEILAITKDTNKLSEIKDLKKSLKIPFPVLLDSEAEVYSEFGVFVFPSTALIDRNRAYRFHYGGFREDYQNEIFGQTRILLGLITEKELQAEKEKEPARLKEEQKRAINYVNLGKTLRKRGMDEKAMQEFKKAVKLDPSNPEGHIFLGFSLLDQKKIDQALQHFQRGVELDPRSTDAKIGLGRAYRMKGEMNKALGILQAGLDLCPDSAIIHLELGIVYESLGRTDEALEHYKASAKYSLKKRNY